MSLRTPNAALAALPVLAALSSAACAPTFDPASEVKGFRLLAVLAASPELTAPEDPDPTHPHATALQSLIATPAYLAPGGEAYRSLVVHVTCTPAPGDPAPSPCTLLTELADPKQFLEQAIADPAAACTGGGKGAPDAITFTGAESCGLTDCLPVVVKGTSVILPTPTYQVPAGFYDKLPADSPQQELGVEAVDLVLALDVAPEALTLATVPANPECSNVLAPFVEAAGAEWPAHPHVVAIKRIPIAGPAPVNSPNQNPKIDGVNLVVGTTPPWPGITPAPATSPTPLTPGVHVDLLPDNTNDLVESYWRLDGNGVPIEQKLEDRAYSWFSTGGKFKDDNTTAADHRADYEPASGPALIWTVARDLRGGTDWKVVEVVGQ
jgi:hypothetical protein